MAPSPDRRTSRLPAEGEVVEVDEQGRTVSREGVSVAGNPHLELLERIYEAAEKFNEDLPNFICDQLVVRYESKTLKPDWKYQDRLEIDLVYLDGVEDYRNIRRNGKRIKDQEAAIRSGTWSTGEFGTILIDILSTALPESFQFRKDSVIDGIAVKIYDFKVLQERSRWRIRYGPEVKPAYQGSLWVDPVTARVIRIEMDSKAFHKTYEIEKVETVVDYRWTNVGGKRFLLPVKSENLSCIRDSFTCLRNSLEFRNYRKFEVESEVLTSDSDISFPEAEGGAKAGNTTPPSLTPEAKPTQVPTQKKKK